MSELIERRFSNETGEFLFELTLSNVTTIFECDIQLSANILSQYKSMLRFKGISTQIQKQQSTTSGLSNNNQASCSPNSSQSQSQSKSSGQKKTISQSEF